ncbi:MAG: hypothetical protein ABMA26_05930 [Limisphaerales bacterium]
MNEGFLIAGVVLLASLIGGGLYYLDRRARRNAFMRWAAIEGYRIIDFQPPFITELSPFPIIASKAQQVYQFTVQLADGTCKSGWVLLGSMWEGLDSDEVEVRWDT